MQSDKRDGLGRATPPAIAALALFLAACVSPSQTPPPAVQDVSQTQALVNDGRDIAEAQCAACHAVGTYGVSPNPAAPVFRTLLSRYHADVLEQELIEGIQVAHPMPEFQFNPQGADALIAFLHSVQVAPANADRPPR